MRTQQQIFGATTKSALPFPQILQKITPSIIMLAASCHDLIRCSALTTDTPDDTAGHQSQSPPPLSRKYMSLLPPSQAWRPTLASPSYVRWMSRPSVTSRLPTTARRRSDTASVRFCHQLSVSAALALLPQSGMRSSLDDLSMQLMSLLAASALRDGSETAKPGKVSLKDELERFYLNNKQADRSSADFSRVRQQTTYQASRHPCVFLQGVFGFSTITLVSSLP